VSPSSVPRRAATQKMLCIIALSPRSDLARTSAADTCARLRSSVRDNPQQDLNER